MSMQPPLGSGWPIARERLLAESLAVAQQQAGVGEARMKSGAPWTDRTTHARLGLKAETEITRAPLLTSIRMIFSHSIEYGKWLETVKGAAMGMRATMSEDELARAEYIGPYAIIHPTVRSIFPDFRNAILSRWRAR